MRIKVISKAKPVKLLKDLKEGDYFTFTGKNSITSEKGNMFVVISDENLNLQALDLELFSCFSIDDDEDKEVTTYKQTSPLELTEE